MLKAQVTAGRTRVSPAVQGMTFCTEHSGAELADLQSLQFRNSGMFPGNRLSGTTQLVGRTLEGLVPVPPLQLLDWERKCLCCFWEAKRCDTKIRVRR